MTANTVAVWDALSTAIWKRLVMVTIDLDRGDNAQIIFETLNARGTPLLAADLIKNHLFQTATIQGSDIDALYEQHWQALDTDWWRDEVVQGRLKRPRLNIFLNHWLAMSIGSGCCLASRWRMDDSTTKLQRSARSFIRPRSESDYSATCSHFAQC